MASKRPLHHVEGIWYSLMAYVFLMKENLGHVMVDNLTGSRCPNCGAPSSSGSLCVRCQERSTNVKFPSWAPITGKSSGIVLEGKYRLLEELGRGGMGTVFRALDESLDRVVAVKFLLPELQADKTLVERFRREAQAMASVRHENVLQIFSFGLYGSTSFFVMEYIEGVTAEQLLENAQERKVFLRLSKLLPILEQAASGLGAVHRAGVVHRDVKPANIMVEAETGRTVIMDFGIGKRYNAGDIRRTKTPSGSPAYMAPEVVSGQEISSDDDHLSDIYAFGVTAFELLTSTLPFDSENWVDILVKHVTELPPTPSSQRAGLPSEADEIILKCLAKAPQERFQTCEDLQKALHPLVAPKPVRESTPLPDNGREASSSRLAKSEKVNTEVARCARIIVTDPDLAFQNLAYHTVEEFFPGSRFQASKTSTKALELALASPPLLLVAPLDDPQLNGLELAATIWSHSELRNVLLVLTCERITAGERRMLQEMGVFQVMLKPVEPPDMKELMKKVVQRAEAFRTRRDSSHGSC